MNLCRIQKNVETSSGNSAWAEVQDHELGSLLSSLSLLESEKRRLSVQLEAAQEALFVHQNKTRNIIDALEEEIVQLKEWLSRGKEREEAASVRISALEKALEDMQLEKQTLQKRSSSEAEAVLHSEVQLREAAEEELRRLTRDLELKTEENIGLRMTILKVQEDLTKENRLQERAIDERDRIIKQLKKTLSEIRLETDARSMSNLLTPDSEGETGEGKRQENNWTPPATDSEDASEPNPKESPDSPDRHRIEDKEEEIFRLREENCRLKCQLQQVRGRLQNEKNQKNSDADSSAERIPNCNDLEDDTDDEDEQKAPSKECRLHDQQQCERLRQALRESQESAKLAQDRADHVTYLLNQKLIELNKLQLTLSSQTKEMIQLEKAYFHLRSHLSRSYRSPSAGRSSRIDVTTTSS